MPNLPRDTLRRIDEEAGLEEVYNSVGDVDTAADEKREISQNSKLQDSTTNTYVFYAENRAHKYEVCGCKIRTTCANIAEVSEEYFA
jgi:hypothetical protein